MTDVIINRRLNPSGKSLPNREQFKLRAKQEIKRALAGKLKDRKVTDTGGENVSIPTDGIQEPTFHHSRNTGRKHQVVPGNKEFVAGDTIPRPQGGGDGGGRGGSPDGSGEDAFQFALTKEEFFELFFEELELPDLVKKGLKQTFATELHRAGFTVSGSPSNLSIPRTMRRAKMRTIGLKRPKAADIEELERQLAKAQAREDEKEVTGLTLEIERQTRRMVLIPFIDPLDTRYRRFERFPKPVTQAVMFCIMDVSGSMTEAMKDLAKRFFMLLHVFLTRRYEHVEVVFIRHTSTAEEVDEETFFYSRETGGTVVSSSLEKMLEIARLRYNSGDWNIYGAQASDGDNYGADSSRCISLLGEEVLPLCQYYFYVEVGDGTSGSLTGLSRDSDLWRAYTEVASKHHNFAMRRIGDPTQVFEVFSDLFAKGGARNAA